MKPFYGTLIDFIFHYNLNIMMGYIESLYMYNYKHDGNTVHENKQISSCKDDLFMVSLSTNITKILTIRNKMQTAQSVSDDIKHGS